MFLSENNCLEHEFQKGFTLQISRTLNHTTQISNRINKARIKLRSLVITLLDLKNSICEVHHNVIYEVLRYHHFPDHINHFIESLYSGCQTSVITSDSHTSYIPIGRGVLPIVLVLSSSTYAFIIRFSNTLRLLIIVNLGFLLIAVNFLIQFTGFNLQTMKLLLVVKKVKINTCAIASPFGTIGQKWLFELLNVSHLELKMSNRINPIPTKTSGK